jgi:hypothetical protein
MNRRNFISAATLTGTALGLSLPTTARTSLTEPMKIGVIGLDTSHATTFVKYFNVKNKSENFRVVAAYPHGSADKESSVSRIPKYTEEVKSYGVEIVYSIARIL